MSGLFSCTCRDQEVFGGRFCQAGRAVQLTEMYGPPPDCKGKVDGEESLRQCIRQFSGNYSLESVPEFTAGSQGVAKMGVDQR